jgi:hypothetical protein
MLTDIFARRYESRQLFSAVGPRELALFVQAYRLIDEQIFPYYSSEKKVNDKSKAAWTTLHDRLSMEIGLKELSPRYYSYQGEWMGKPHTYSGWYDMNRVCEAWLTKPFSADLDPDVFVKRRISFVELAFREREQQLEAINHELPATLRTAAIEDALPRRSSGLRIPGAVQSHVDRAKRFNEFLNSTFAANVHELNERFKQAGMPLNYHNGFVQITTDPLTQAQIEQPFWKVISGEAWKNVSIDMATAIDLRDSAGRDPAFYAGKALESTIKIICNKKGWTTGNEKGCSDFLNHLESKSNGRYIDPWERQVLQAFFSHVRNDYGHGPGDDPMPVMTPPQTDQTIEFCMAWIKSLVNRL